MKMKILMKPNKTIIKTKYWISSRSIDIPIADAERGNFPCPFMYTNNLFLLVSCSQEDFWIDSSSRP